jgi:hypothetical protein
VTVRRTESLDAAIELIRTQRNLLPIDYPPDYPNHLRSEKRRVVKDELGRKAVEYVKTGDDDYLMAEVYDVVAEAMLLIQMEVDDAQAQVFTPLDEMLEFQRSSVNDLGDAEMRFGPDEGGLGPGDHEEEWPPEEV